MNRPQHCIKCRLVPENIFSLSCDHPLCLPCAYSLTEQSEHLYQIMCLQCQEETTFDEPLYVALASQVSRGKRQKSSNNKKKGRHKYPEPQLSHLLQIDRYCSEHTDHDLAYVCKTCQNKLVCPECVINGHHKHHQVATIQHEGNHIKTTIENKISSLRHKLTDLKTMQTSRLSILQERKQELEELRFNIKQQYDQIKQKIKQEESSIMGRCSQLIDAHLQEEQSFNSQIQLQIQSCQHQRQQFIQLLDPFLADNGGFSSRTNQKLQTLTLIANYHALLREKEQRSSPEQPFSTKDTTLNSQVEELISQLRKTKPSPFTIKLPTEMMPLNNNNENLPAFGRKLNMDKDPYSCSFGKRKSKGGSGTQYFQLI